MKAWPSALSEEQQSRQIRTVLDELSWKLDIIKRLSCDASADASDDTEFAALQKLWKTTVEDVAQSNRTEASDIALADSLKNVFREANRMKVRTNSQKVSPVFAKEYPIEDELCKVLGETSRITEMKLSTRNQDFGRLTLHDLLSKGNHISLAHLEKEIESISSKLEECTRKGDEEISRRRQDIQKLEDAIKQIQSVSAETVNRLTTKLKHKQELGAVKHTETMKQLREEHAIFKKQLAQFQQSYKQEELTLRKRREKLQEELKAWNVRYDSEVGEKHSEIEALKSMHGKELQKFTTISDKYAKTSLEYQGFVNAKTDQLNKARNRDEKINSREKSATKIQAVWRGHKVRKTVKVPSVPKKN